MTRLNDMVFQLRKLADLQTAPIEQTPVRLDELLNELVTEFSASKPNLTLNVPRVPWSLPEVRGDMDLLYLALRNVLGNAVKFTQPEDAIQVRAFEDTNHIVVEVAYPWSRWGSDFRRSDSFRVDGDEGWTISPHLDLDPERGGSGPGWRPMAIRLSARNGFGDAGAVLDDVYIDPRARW